MGIRGSAPGYWKRECQAGKEAFWTNHPTLHVLAFQNFDEFLFRICVYIVTY